MTGAARPLGRILTNGGLVALAGVAGWALVSTPEQSSVPAVVIDAGSDQVCLDAEPGTLCLDAEHVDHLRLSGLSVQDCAVVTYGGGWVAEGVTRVVRRSCSDL